MVKLKAGVYFVGDPCYVVRDELWGEYVGSIVEGEGEYVIATGEDEEGY